MSSKIDQLLGESPMPLTSASKMLAEFHGGRPIHVTTLARWIHRGHRTRTGTRIKLEAVRLGGKLLVSRAAILRFIQAQQPAEQEPPTVRSPGERQRADAVARAELEAAGAI